jgi:ABC-2 type transport system ATP-binding protein
LKQTTAKGTITLVTKGSKNIITVKNLVKTYRKAKQNAVDNLSFEVREGEFFALLGPNGAGKTTTISILTTTLSKTSGEIKIAGFDSDKESTQVRQHVGIIFQNPSLDQNLTAEENVRFHSILYGLYPFAPTFAMMPLSYQKRVKELAQLIGIEKQLHQQIKTFSGGMKRKLEIIRSLMHKPKVLFLDEPTSGLDPLSRKSLWEYLREVREKEKTTIFLTTHYLEEAEEADRVCVINNGKVVALKTPEELKKDLVKRHLIVESKQKDRLIAELTKLKLPYHEENNKIIADVKNQDMQKLIQSIKVPLSSIDIHNPSLEDAYLELIGGNDARN